MRKIDDFNNLKKEVGEVVEFSNLGVGPQLCRILSVKDVEEKEYLLLLVDIVDGEFKDEFKSRYQRDTKEDKKWAHTATLYRSYKPTATRFFAAFITSVEKSNDGFVFDDKTKSTWDETKLKNKLVVCNFAEEEYLSDDYDDNGDQIAKLSLKIIETRSIGAFKNGDVKVKEPKMLTLTKGQTRTPVYKDNADTPTPNVEYVDNNDTEDDLPF